MSDRSEFESHSMGPSVNAVYQISRGCDKVVAEKIVTKIPYHWP
jgi:hypothetical protein